MQRPATVAHVPPRPIGVLATLPDEDIAWLARQAELAGVRVHPLPAAFPRTPSLTAQQIARMPMRELVAEAARPARSDTDWIEMEPV